MTNSQSQPLTVKQRCEIVHDKALLVHRSPREDEIEYTTGNDNTGKEIPLAIFFNMVFNDDTQQHIGFILKEEDGTMMMVLMETNGEMGW